MKIDFMQLKALLKKELSERNPLKKDAAGSFLRLVTYLLLGGAFVYFFSRFLGVYLEIPTAGVPAREERLFEALSVVYALLLLSLIASGAAAGELNRSEDLKLFAALPLSENTIFLAKLIVLYFKQLLFSAFCVGLVNLTAGIASGQGASFYLLSLLPPFLLPMIALAFSSVLTLPYDALLRFLKPRFVLSFVLITLLTAVGIFAYSLLLAAVKELLLGDELKYFFKEGVMNAIASAVRWLYPVNRAAGLVLGRSPLKSGAELFALAAVCFAVALPVMRGLLRRTLQARGGAAPLFYRKGGLKKRHSPLYALLQKEFSGVLRTPAYAFSYFSVAVAMPLMVYFGMSVGDSLTRRVLGVDCTGELALFLTLMYGALTNVFCAANISREGNMFLTMKGFPLRAGEVFGAKILFCMAIGTLSQAASAIVLYAAGYVRPLTAAALFAAGILFAFAQICLSTAYDFRHTAFSADEEGEVGDRGSAVALLSLALAFLIGGGTLLVRLFDRMSTGTFLALPMLLVPLLAAGAAFSLFFRLERRYSAFEEGV